MQKKIEQDNEKLFKISQLNVNADADAAGFNQLQQAG